MKEKLKILWSFIIIICMFLVVRHLIWSAQTTLFTEEDVIEQTFTSRK